MLPSAQRLTLLAAWGIGTLGGCTRPAADPPAKSSPNPPATVVADAVRPATTADVWTDVDAKGLDVAVVQALETARRAVDQSPQDAAAWGHLGELFLAHDVSLAASQCLGQARRLQSDQPRWEYLEGVALRQLNPDACLERLLHAVPKFAAHLSAPRLRLAEVLMDRDRLPEAETWLKQVLQQEPANLAAHTDLAQIALLQGDARACLSQLQVGLSRSTVDRRTLLLAAEAYRRLGSSDAAERYRGLAERAAESNWSDPIFVQVLEQRVGLLTQLKHADQLFAQNHVDESVTLLRQVVTQYPESEWAHILLARGLIRQRKLDDAERTLAATLQLNPRSFEAHFRMAVMYQVSSRHAEARDWFERAIKLQPGNAVAYRNLAASQLALHDVDGAEASLLAAVKSQPNFFEGHLALADFYYQRGQTGQGRAAVAAATRIRPQDPRLKELTRRFSLDVNPR